jgi:hypothetical protein
MAKFRKRPVVIEAVQWTGPDVCVEVFDFLGWTHSANEGDCPEEEILIPTLEGVMTASRGDWVIKGIQGEFYPCKPDIFEKTYEPVDG